jgi:hypothetical protein
MGPPDSVATHCFSRQRVTRDTMGAMLGTPGCGWSDVWAINCAPTVSLSPHFRRYLTQAMTWPHASV